ncbi:hypothetical protein DYB38_005009 [Aphanomyces astaci]|uniref:Uncharacterized protein n=1 Tax=Aphanomyces astaci TaxID=112090 RepID=A0A397DD93_APHAT|nr:hypothetical protein DYB38_005009 [Aphanomyces astaci]
MTKLYDRSKYSTMVVYAVDVGGSTLKHGDVAGATYAVSSNCVRVNAKQHTAQIRRPIERGYVVNWTLQGDIWQEALTVDPEATLLLTTPVFTPEKLLHTQDEVVFEEFHMAGMANVIPQAMVPLTLSSPSPVHVIVDVGFSATHIVPWIDGSFMHVLRVGVECIAVPEVLFHPSDIGIDQDGIAGGIADAIAACPPFVQGQMYQHIVVTGGSSKFPHFIDRLRVDLRPLVPAEYALHVTLHDEYSRVLFTDVLYVCI